MSAIEKARAALVALEKGIEDSPFAEEDAVIGYTLLAIAEELRTANLLTLSTAVHSVRFPDDSNPQAAALDDALEALGFPRRDGKPILPGLVSGNPL